VPASVVAADDIDVAAVVRQGLRRDALAATVGLLVPRSIRVRG
jgi:hypothetical protein